MLCRYIELKYLEVDRFKRGRLRLISFFYFLVKFNQEETKSDTGYNSVIGIMTYVYYIHRFRTFPMTCIFLN